MLRLRNTLRENVLVRILLFALIGIIISENYKHLFNFTLIIIIYVIAITSLVVFTIYFLNQKNVTFNKFNGILIYLITLFLFIIIHFTNQEINHISYCKAIQDSTITLEIKDDKLVKNSHSIYPTDIIYNNKIVGNIYLTTDSNTIELKYSDRIIIKNKIKTIRKKDWPGSFNYEYYLNTNHIYHQLKIRNDDILKIEKNKTNPLLKFSYQSRNKLIEILQKNIKEESVFELSAALLLGYRTDLENKVLETFSRTGTIHIISVSGLHVGIIFFVLQWIVRKSRLIKSKIFESIILIFSIWMYSLLTGLPPSVCRCSTMISFNIIARIIDQRTSAFNMLAASALILLTINTNMLFDIGFQLSYLAVFGILYLQKWIDNLLYIKNKYVQQIWTLITVSIAAQLTTLPFCLYYFHQFPNYFIPANMIAIPLSSIALYSSILTIICSPINWLITLCDFSLKWSITIMNYSLNTISELPYAVSDNIYINKIQLIFICVYIILLVLLFVHKYRSIMKYIFMLMIIHLIYDEYNKSSNIGIHYISNNSTIPIYTYRDNDVLKHVISMNTNTDKINKFIKSWKNLGHFKHELFFFNQNEKVYIENKLHKILIGDKKLIRDLKYIKTDYLITNTRIINNNINSIQVISNKDVNTVNSINTSKSGYISF